MEGIPITAIDTAPPANEEEQLVNVVVLSIERILESDSVREIAPPFPLSALQLMKEEEFVMEREEEGERYADITLPSPEERDKFWKVQEERVREGMGRELEEEEEEEVEEEEEGGGRERRGE